MLAARGLGVELGRRPILADVSVSLAPGELTVLVGPNGAGKTTLLRTLTGALTPRLGQVELDGVPLSRWGGRQLARRRAVLSQSASLGFPFTVHEVVGLGVSAGGEPAPADRRRLIAEALATVDISHFGERLFPELSGGEQQRVQIARVLAQLAAARALPDAGDAPQWLFLDEPTAGLDVAHQLQILDIARDHARAGGGAVAVLHDLNLAMRYSDRLIIVSKGRIAADGDPADVLSEQRLCELFSSRLRLVETAEGRFVLPAAA